MSPLLAKYALNALILLTAVDEIRRQLRSSPPKRRVTCSTVRRAAIGGGEYMAAVLRPS